MTELQKQSIITLLPKPNKDTIYIENWRPISLLNIDYKIIAKVIANRIKNVLPLIISQNQSGFVKDRYIGENIRTIFADKCSRTRLFPQNRVASSDARRRSLRLSIERRNIQLRLTK